LRNHLRIDATETDAQVQAFLETATAQLDAADGRLNGFCIGEQTWWMFAPCFPANGVLRLALRPVMSITSVIYTDAAGAEQTLPTTDWRWEDDTFGDVILRPSGITWPQTAERGDAVRITAVLGHAPADMPAPVLQAVRLMVAHYFENRAMAAFGGGFGHLPEGVEELTQSYRNGFWLGSPE
jgi:uncharacterized phiE125 gp8 family phage protein